MNEMTDRWLSVKEICSYMGVSSDTVYRWVETHEMPVHRMGR
jgi:excisionase family DNA binding protein